MKRSTIFVALLLMASAAIAAPKKFKDDPSLWSLQVGPTTHLVFRFPQRVFLCPFNELSGAVATRWTGRGMHWMEIAHPTARGTNAHYWVEIIEPDGKLAEHAQQFFGENGMTTTYNEVTWKPNKLTKTTIVGKTAYSATYKTKLRSTLAQVAFEVTGTFWMFDIDKSRVILQADAFREGNDPVPTLMKALSIDKKPAFNDFKIVQTTATQYRYFSMPMPQAPASMTQMPDGSLCTWAVIGAKGEEIGAIKMRQYFLGSNNLTAWREATLFSSLRGRNIEQPEGLVVPRKIGGREAFAIEFPTKTDDEANRDAVVRSLCFTDGTYAIELYAISYDPNPEKGTPIFNILERSAEGVIVWMAN
jgi:hypothetical protein